VAKRPANALTESGPWEVVRQPRRPTATATSKEGATLASLADRLGFARDEWRHWLRVAQVEGGGVRLASGAAVALDDLRETDELAPGQAFEVPNTIAMLWYGDLGGVGKAAVGWARERRYAARLGFHVAEFNHSSRRQAAENERGALDLLRLTEGGRLHGLIAAGHGNPYSFGNSQKKSGGLDYQDASRALRYRLPLVVMHVCDGDWSRHEQAWERKGARDLSSGASGCVFFGVKGTFYPDIPAPVPAFVYRTNAKHLWELLQPGEQGTRDRRRPV
jgi:hypothetical protein